jgi:hypothetical protein
MHSIGIQPTVEKTDHASQRDWTGFSPRYSTGLAAVALKNPSMAPLITLTEQLL